MRVSVIAIALRHMLAAGMDHESIVAAVAEMEIAYPRDEQAQRRREADRLRKSLRKSAESAESAEALAVASPLSPPDKETSPTPPKEINPPIPPTRTIPGVTPRQHLEAVLDAERAGAVLDHRKRIGKPMTAHGAKLLAAKFAQCPNPNAGADAMIANGWQGFEPDWMERRAVGVRAPPKREETVSDVIARLKTEMTAADDRPDPYPDRDRPASLSFFENEYTGNG